MSTGFQDGGRSFHRVRREVFLVRLLGRLRDPLIGSFLANMRDTLDRRCAFWQL